MPTNSLAFTDCTLLPSTALVKSLLLTKPFNSNSFFFYNFAIVSSRALLFAKIASP